MAYSFTSSSLNKKSSKVLRVLFHGSIHGNGSLVISFGKLLTICLMGMLIFSTIGQHVEGINSQGGDVSKCKYKVTKSLGPTMTLSWNVLKNPSDSSNYILEFGLICTKAGYCSIGFDHPYGKGMQSIDTLFAYTSSGTAYVEDCYCTNKKSIPTIDSNNGGSNDYLETNGGIFNGQYHYRWSRKVNTGDSQDAIFKNSNVYVSWAYHSSSTSISATHTAYDRNIQINFLASTPTETYVSGMINNETKSNSNTNTGGSGNGNSEDDDDDDEDDDKSKLHLYHLYALGIAVFALIVLGVITTYLPTAFKSNVITHFLLYRKVSKVIPYDFPGVSFINQLLDLTIGELVVILVYAGLNVVWFVYGYLENQKVSSAFAKVIVFNYIFLFIPVTRYNVLQALFGISFERSIKFHKWIGVMVFLSATAHGIAEFIEFKDNIPFIFSVDDGFPLLGIIAWLALGLLLLFSMGPIRRKLYELFLVFHIPLTFITVTFSIIHGEGWINLLPYMAFSIILMLIDWTLRLVIGFGLHTELISISYDEDAEVTTCVFEKRFLTFFHNPNHAHFVFVYIPQVSIYQLHPMTISSCVKLQDGNHQFTCHIKKMEGGTWSSKLASLAKSNKSIDSYHGVRVEGAYGNLSIPFFNGGLFSSQQDKKRTIVFIVAGIGATPCNAILTALDDPKYNDPTPYKVFVNVTMRNEAMIRHFAKMLQHKPNIECTFYITGTKPSKKSIEMMEKGVSTGMDNGIDRRFIRGARPNYGDYMNRVKAEVIQSKSLGYVSVFTCGPSSMMEAVHNVVWSCSDSSCRFELHKEEFEF